MSITSFSPDTVLSYKPAHGFNRDSESPCVVRLKFLPYAKMQKYTRLIAAKSAGVTDPEKLTQIAQDVQKKQFVENVDSVSGYYLDGREIIDPAEFYESADKALVFDILAAMESIPRLTEGLEKPPAQAKN